MTEALAKFCPGCGYPISLLFLKNALEKMSLTKDAVLGLDIGCSLLALNYLPINTFQTHHGRVTPTMVGFKRAKPGSVCIGYTGDGGAYAIGLQNLIHAAKRDEPITIIVINNTVYAMTGGQSAPTTRVNQKTQTNPLGNDQEPFFGPEFIKSISSGGSFIARTAVDEPKQLSEYITKAIQTQQAGHFSLVEVLAFCPTNWKTKGQQTLDYLKGLKDTFKLGVI